MIQDDSYDGVDLYNCILELLLEKCDSNDIKLYKGIRDDVSKKLKCQMTDDYHELFDEAINDILNFLDD